MLACYIVLFSALLFGFSSCGSAENALETVVRLNGPQDVKGNATLRQETPNSPVTFEGEIFNLPAGIYEINVHNSGDVSEDCVHVGSHFNPTGQRHGKLTDPERHAGDLGTIESIDGTGHSFRFRIMTPSLSLSESSRRSIINRSLVISKRMDPEIESSEINYACGIISPRQSHQERTKTVAEQDFPYAGTRFYVQPDKDAVQHGGNATDDQRLRRIFVMERRKNLTGVYNVLAEENVDNIGLDPEPQHALSKPVYADLVAEVQASYHEELSKCYLNLGCVETDSSWYDPKYRVINVPPAELSAIGTTFLLRTREYCFEEIVLNPLSPASIVGSQFHSRRPTKFIVHGFTNSGHDPWVTRLVNALLTAGDFNVIVVDWMRGALPIYAQATANTRVVGLQIAYLIRLLQRYKGLRPEDVHIIGHSLGAQVAGYAGHNITNLGRITGLDPAGPYFANMPTHVRLDPSDALFVEALHTNALVLFELGYGTTELVGHIDFFPNGGKYQPGCELLSLLSIPYIKQYWNSGDIFACNHNRAVDLFTDAITTPMVGFECQDYDTFLQAACNASRPNDRSCRAHFGLHADPQALGGRQHVQMFFRTSAFSPYALIHYRLVIHTDPSQTTKAVRGFINMTIIGDKNEILKHPLSRDAITIIHGANQPFLFTSPVDVGKITEVRFYWIQPTCWPPILRGICGDVLYVKTIQFGQMSLEDPEALKARRLHPCLPGSSSSVGRREAPSDLAHRISPGEMRRFVATSCGRP